MKKEIYFIFIEKSKIYEFIQFVFIMFVHNESIKCKQKNFKFIMFMIVFSRVRFFCCYSCSFILFFCLSFSVFYVLLNVLVFCLHTPILISFNVRIMTLSIYVFRKLKFLTITTTFSINSNQLII